jgi:DMSO/TMAO reductase YedYZ molybdopterin-dependent catalytic subunit
MPTGGSRDIGAPARLPGYDGTAPHNEEAAHPMPPLAPTHPWHAPPPSEDLITVEELQLAARNPGTPLEALVHNVTPTGLHYVLTRFDIPMIDPATWRLGIDGQVERALSPGLDELRAMPAATLTVTMECAGNGRAGMRPRPLGIPWLGDAVGTAEWTGARLADVLAIARPRADTVEFAFAGADRGIERGYTTGFTRALAPAEITADVLLAYAMNGQPLPPQHGAPLRLIVPGWYGMASVKWLDRITAMAEPVEAYHQRIGYHFRATADAPGTPIRYMRVRALMVPPGMPDFFTRRRYAARGLVRLSGRAWSGAGVPVVRVSVGIDGDWHEAMLDAPVGAHAWRGWQFDWQAEPGPHILSCRATDAAGAAQPLDPVFDWGGMGNNGVQRIDVVVE